MIRVFKGISLIISLILSLFVINLAQMPSVILLPFSTRKFRRWNQACAEAWGRFMVASAKFFNPVRFVLTGDPLPRGENALLIANHLAMIDIFVIVLLANEKNAVGRLKWFAKESLKYVPGLGWGMAFIDCIFVKRDWNSDRKKITTTFNRFLKDQIPIWLITFSEGTRMSSKKLISSQRYARKHDLPILEHVLVPKTKGFVASVRGLSDHLQAVYDITLGYPQKIPTIWDVASGRVTEFHVRIKRYEVAKLPEDPDQLSSWLMDRFIEKDRILKRFYEEKKFSR